MWIFDQKLGFLMTCLAASMMVAPGMSRSAPATVARFSSDRGALYAGEAFQLTLTIYISGETLDKQINIANLPAPTDLQLRSVEELPLETEVHDGRAYEVRKFRTWARPSKAGSLVLAPRLDGTTIQTTRAFFMVQEMRQPLSIPVEPFTLTIHPVPLLGRPAGFSGLAGSFSFTVQAKPLDIAEGDLITLTYTIAGDWLPDTFPKPSIRTGKGLKAYELKPIPEDCSPTKQVYQQTVVPENSSVTSVPACSFSYFDTRTAGYKTQTGGPFRIRYHVEHILPQPIYAPTQLVSATSTQSPFAPSNSTGEGKWRKQLSHHFWNKQEIIVQGDAEIIVRLAPSEASQELFTLKPGTSVMEEGVSDDWLRISCPKGIGWIPQRQNH